MPISEIEIKIETTSCNTSLIVCRISPSVDSLSIYAVLYNMYAVLFHWLFSMIMLVFDIQLISLTSTEAVRGCSVLWFLIEGRNSMFQNYSQRVGTVVISVYRFFVTLCKIAPYRNSLTYLLTYM